MTNVITTWREAVETHLRVVFDGATIEGGRRATVNREPEDLILIFHPGMPVIQRDDTLASPTLLVRYFPSLSKQPSTSSPRDQAALEQAEVDLLLAFAGKNRVGDFAANLACRVTGVVLHDSAEEWFVELELKAYTLNPAMPAA